MADMRSFLFSMKKIKNPVVISGIYNKKLQLYFICNKQMRYTM